MINIVKGEISTIDGDEAQIVIPGSQNVVSYKFKISNEVLSLRETPLVPGTAVIAVMYSRTDGVIIATV